LALPPALLPLALLPPEYEEPPLPLLPPEYDGELPLLPPEYDEPPLALLPPEYDEPPLGLLPLEEEPPPALLPPEYDEPPAAKAITVAVKTSRTVHTRIFRIGRPFASLSRIGCNHVLHDEFRQRVRVYPLQHTNSSEH